MTAPAFPQKTILVVDDEPLVCDAVKMMLNFDGHVVQTAASGQEALAILEKQGFDLVITDFEMPNMKGDELAAAIKARAPKRDAARCRQPVDGRGLRHQQALPAGEPSGSHRQGQPVGCASRHKRLAAHRANRLLPRSGARILAEAEPPLS